MEAGEEDDINVKLEIIKQDADDKTPLAGAGFRLREGDYWATDEVITGDDGKAYINIGRAGTFDLYETKAPSGYNLSEQINYDSSWGSYRGYITVDSSGGYSYYFWGTRNGDSELSIIFYNSKRRRSVVAGGGRRRRRYKCKT